MVSPNNAPEPGTAIGKETKYRVFDPAILPNPYPQYRRIREHEPIFRNPRGIWRISRYRDVRFVLRDSRFGHGDGSAQAAILGGHEIEGYEGSASRGFTFLDPPDHTRLRNLVSRAFTFRTVQRMEPRVREIAKELTEGLAGRGEADLVSDYAYPLLMTVICELLGIPERDRGRFRYWTALVMRSLDTELALNSDEVAERERMRRDFLGYAGELADFRLKEPGDDLISKLVTTEQNDDRLTRPELLMTIVTLISAGWETTVSALTNCILALLSHPGQRAFFLEHPERIEESLNEILRYDPPVHYTVRVALDDVELEGHQITKGDIVVVMMASANHDTQIVDDPENLNLARPPEQQVVFGQGIHFCLGAQLARIELRQGLTVLFQRFPDMRLARQEQKYLKNYVVRTLAELPVLLG